MTRGTMKQIVFLMFPIPVVVQSALCRPPLPPYKAAHPLVIPPRGFCAIQDWQRFDHKLHARHSTLRANFKSLLAWRTREINPLNSAYGTVRWLWPEMDRSVSQCWRREGGWGLQDVRPGHEIKRRMQRDTRKTNRVEGLPARFKQPQPLLNCTDYFLAPNTKT